MDRDDPPPARIVVGVITRERPVMFERLADSLARLEVPEGAELRFVIAENNDRATIAQITTRLAEASGRPCTLVIEPRLGVPYARNAVLNRALEEGATHLAFIDDDEKAPADWILRLFTGLKRSTARMVAGPVLSELDPADLPLGFFARRLYDGYLAEEARRHISKARKVAEEMGHSFATATNNWMIDLGPVRDNGLRFRESIGLGSGSDTAFWHDWRNLGEASDWVPDAPVAEVVPASRLTLRYRISRAQAHGWAEWEHRKPGARRFATAKGLVRVVSDLIKGGVLMAVGMVVPGGSLFNGTRLLGRGLGRLSSMTRRRGSGLYRTIHGS